MKTASSVLLSFAVVMLCAFAFLTAYWVASYSVIEPSLTFVIAWGASGALAAGGAVASTLLHPKP